MFDKTNLKKTKIYKQNSREILKLFLSKLKAFKACCTNFFNFSYSQNIKNEIMFSRLKKSVRKQQAKNKKTEK